jgi:hypothetical protein
MIVRVWASSFNLRDYAETGVNREDPDLGISH